MKRSTEIDVVDSARLNMRLQELCGESYSVEPHSNNGLSGATASIVTPVIGGGQRREEHANNRKLFLKTANSLDDSQRIAHEVALMSKWDHTGLPLPVLDAGQGYMITPYAGEPHLEWTDAALHAACTQIEQAANKPMCGTLKSTIAFTDRHAAMYQHLDEPMRTAGLTFLTHYWNIAQEGCHGDPHRHNWVRTKSGALQLIDWETSSGGPYGWDLMWLTADAEEVSAELRLSILKNVLTEPQLSPLLAAFRMKGAATRRHASPPRARNALRWYTQVGLLWETLHGDNLI